jgi:proline iminopeptidase
VVCPVANAWDLKKAWPKADLEITPASGHSAFEAENVDALVRATDRFAG